MAISGPAINTPQPPSNAMRGFEVWRIIAGCVTPFAVAAGLLMLSACSTTISFGSMPRIDSLQTLTIGTSKADEVIRALGEPRGHGRAKFRADLPEQEIWQYEYLRSDGAKAQAKMLLVFMHQGIYYGHMWFSSNQLMGLTK